MDTRTELIEQAVQRHEALMAEAQSGPLPEGHLTIPVGGSAAHPSSTPEPVLLPSTIVLLYPSPAERRGAPYMPAFVTRVWGKGMHPAVNLVAFAEDGETLVFESVQHASVRSELSKAEDGRYWAYRNQ